MELNLPGATCSECRVNELKTSSDQISQSSLHHAQKDSVFCSPKCVWGTHQVYFLCQRSTRTNHRLFLHSQTSQNCVQRPLFCHRTHSYKAAHAWERGKRVQRARERFAVTSLPLQCALVNTDYWCVFVCLETVLLVCSQPDGEMHRSGLFVPSFLSRLGVVSLSFLRLSYLSNVPEPHSCRALLISRSGQLHADVYFKNIWPRMTKFQQKVLPSLSVAVTAESLPTGFHLFVCSGVC